MGSRRKDTPGIFSFYHTWAPQELAGNMKRNGMYSMEFQDDRVWILGTIETVWSGVQTRFVTDAADRWTFRAYTVNETHVTYMVDGDFGTVEFRTGGRKGRLDALWWGYPAAETGAINHTELRYMRAMSTPQQLQQLWHKEAASYLSCPPGQFHDAKNNGLCSRCARNTFTRVEGATECELCPAGYEAVNVSSTGCTICGTSFFSVSGSSCQPCPPGTASNASGASACKPCAPGYFSDSPGQGECKACPVGSQAAGIQEVRCTQCTSGKFAAETGSTECTRCRSGTYQPNGSAGACSSCPPTYDARWRQQPRHRLGAIYHTCAALVLRVLRSHRAAVRQAP